MPKTSKTSDFVLRARNTLKLTQTEFGKLLGKGRHTIRRYETPGYPLPESSRLAIVGLLAEAKRKGR